MLHSQINAHKESLPFLMSKKWEAVHCAGEGLVVWGMGCQHPIPQN
jgi:hypothetical protein